MFGRPVPQRNNDTHSATIAPTDTGKPMSIYRQQNATDLMANTGETKAQPIRNPAHAFFNINSIDRYASASNPTSQFALVDLSYNLLNANPASNFNMSLQRNLLSGYFHRLTVSDANLQWNIPTINSQNYIFPMSTKLGDTTATAVIAIPGGYYTYQELAVKLQDLIRTAFAPALADLTVTWSAIVGAGGGTNQFCFVFATQTDEEIWFEKQFPQSPIPERLPGTNDGQALRAMYKFYTMIGITSAWIGESQASSGIATTPSYPTLIYTSYIDIISSKLSQFMRVKDSETSFQADTSVITRIYLTNQGSITYPSSSTIGSLTTGTQDLSTGAISTTTVNAFDDFPVGSRPFILNYTPSTPKNINWNPGQAIIDFDIRVVDEFGDTLPWSQYTPTGVGTGYFTEFFEFQLTVLASES